MSFLSTKNCQEISVDSQQMKKMLNMSFIRITKRMYFLEEEVSHMK